MRRRSRSTSHGTTEREVPATNSQQRENVDVNASSREALDHALRAFARLLARQAAREAFEEERTRRVRREDVP
jgi:hypothetical protein